MKKIILSLILSQGLVAAPIHEAAEKGDIERVRQLINAGADINAAMGVSVRSPFGIEQIRQIINVGVDVDDTSGIFIKTPLSIAVRNSNIDLILLLLNRGADVNVVDNFGATQLAYSAMFNNPRVVNVLISHGADVDAADNIGCAPLHMAVLFGRKNIVDILIRHGADVNSTTYESTPLYIASEEGHMEIVKLFLDNPWCNHRIVAKNDKTSEDIARTNGHTEIADMIHNAPIVMQKVLNSGYGLQLLASRVANKEGVYEEDYNESPSMVKKLITNIRKD